MATTITTMSTKTLIVVVGATGSGKTDLSLRLATHFSAPILSTDSRQLYRGIPIGTAQPTAEQLAAVEHHFIASHDLTDNFNCGEYEVQALARLEELFRKHNIVVAVGGSGLYIDALCRGFDDLPSDTAEVRAELMRRLEEEGLESLVEELHTRDEAHWEVIDRHNPARVVRALEVCITSGRPYSEQRTAPQHERPFDIIKVGITWPREELYERINLRVDLMMEAGLEEEARKVYHLRHLNSLQTVGYKEMFEWFDGNITREEAIELIKRNSRRYAKRQMTWFRRDESIHWVERKDIDEAWRIVEHSI